MDFTIKTYLYLINTLLDHGYKFSTVSDYIKLQQSGVSILRHDVDKSPLNSLEFAKIQYKLGIQGTYYFRIVPQSLDERIIKEIESLGHEIGYHYEDMNLARKSSKKLEGNHNEKTLIEMGFDSFKKNLERLRKLAGVSTISMHGSPLSKWDNRILWKFYDYKDFGIKCEPYFDITLDRRLYLTDTGRTWNGFNISIRDRKTENSTSYCDWKVKPVKGSLMNMSVESNTFQKMLGIHSTFDIIKNIHEDNLPKCLFMNFHPQRWTSHTDLWVKELLTQNMKNIVKFILIKLPS